VYRAMQLRRSTISEVFHLIETVGEPLDVWAALDLVTGSKMLQIEQILVLLGNMAEAILHLEWFLEVESIRS